MRAFASPLFITLSRDHRHWLIVLANVFVGFITSATSAQQLPLYEASVETTPAGASVYLDAPTGALLGVTPLKSIRLRAGSHVLYFDLEGYDEARLYIEVNRDGQAFSSTLKAAAVLELLPPDEAFNGAQVLVNGEKLGVLPFRGTLMPGRHMVQIKQGKDVLFAQWVELEPGQEMSLTPPFEHKATHKSSILVGGDVKGADVFIDGEAKGKTPLVVQGVSEGRHVVEIKARRRAPYTKEIAVIVGQRVSINPTLDPVGEPREGVMVVNASVGGATVFVDERQRGTVPMVLHNLRDGKHTVSIKAEGHEEYRETCLLGAKTPCEIYAELTPVLAAIRVEANVSYAKLFVNNDEKGAIPFDGYIEPGPKVLEVRAEGYEPFRQRIQLTASSQPTLILATLRGDGSTEADNAYAEDAQEALRQQRGAMPHAAVPLAVGQSYIDLATGWPFLAEMRLGVGVFKFMDVGLALRTFGRLSEIEGRVKVGSFVVNPWAVALQVKGGGGVGPSENVLNPSTDEKESHGVNTWFIKVEALNSINFSDFGAVTLWAALDLHSDRYDFSGENGDELLVPDPGRQEHMRFRVGGALEVILDLHWNLWGLVEGIAASTDGRRRILGDIYGLGMEDTELYFGLGTTYKY